VTVLAPYLKQRFVDSNGAALYLGTVATFAAGGNTPIATFKDSAGIATNTNPITLNPRGECDIWLLPNVAYKLQVNDQFGNLVWTVDNVVSSQLITLYGGVDTGGANAYLLNFTASFTAYADGIIIVWIPANTNTGPSTINVNGLGVVNIINPDGSALAGNQIVANQPAQILFKAGSFELITPAVTANNFFIGAWVGFSAPPASTSISYRRTGNMAAITFNPQTGTSGGGSGTSFQLTGLPAIIQSTVLTQLVSCLGMTDNGAVITTASLARVNAGGFIDFFKDPSLGAWTAAGAKGFNSRTTIIYTL
jgi:hypothetical protein